MAFVSRLQYVIFMGRKLKDEYSWTWWIKGRVMI